jgi:hypothetical protein
MDVKAKCLPPHLRYACRYWVRHVGHSQEIDKLTDSLLGFMRTHFLHWLEALSLLNMLGDGIEAIGDLENVIVGQFSKQSAYFFYDTLIAWCIVEWRPNAASDNGRRRAISYA